MTIPPQLLDPATSPLGLDRLELDVDEWIGGPPVTADDLAGKVVFVEAFQMLCPGCVYTGLPQAQRVHRAFGRDGVVVLGLHTVFEHHDVMTPDALRTFIAEFGLAFRVGIDRPVPGRSMPSTMSRYGLEGTPSTILADREGRIRHISLGAMDDLRLGTMLGRLLAEPAPQPTTTPE